MPSYRNHRDWPAWTDYDWWELAEPDDDLDGEIDEPFEVDDHPPYGPEDDPTEGEAGPYGDDIPF